MTIVATVAAPPLPRLGCAFSEAAMGPAATSAASVPASSYMTQASPWRRASGLAFALGTTVLLVLMLLYISPPFDRLQPRRTLASFGLIDAHDEKAARPHREKVRRQARSATATHSARAQAPAVKSVPWPEGFVLMDSDDFAASDIAKAPHHVRAASQGAGDADAQADAGGAGTGEGAKGQRLYDPDWYSRPTDAELAPYVPRNGPAEGWGLVACRTVERYRVEDCHIIGESPAGSGFGRAVFNAAWQFRVLPPRINGRALVGAWVRIRIDYTQRGAIVGS